MNFEIRQVKNGFCIFIGCNQNRDIFESPWVFETLEAALKFLKEHFENKSAPCGSCHGSGFIK